VAFVAYYGMMVRERVPSAALS